jgi:hypothetical protein
MGFLSFFSKAPSAVKLERLPSGSFTIDRSGQVVSSTLPGGFPENLVKLIGETVLAVFLSAQEQSLPLKEMVIHFAGLKVTARELRGGAIVFLAPKQ